MRRPADLETTSLGAALAAGIGSGFWSQEWVLGGADWQQQDSVFQPQVVPQLGCCRPICTSLVVANLFALANPSCYPASLCSSQKVSLIWMEWRDLCANWWYNPQQSGFEPLSSWACLCGGFHSMP